jgi:hypothetical protein
MNTGSKLALAGAVALAVMVPQAMEAYDVSLDEWMFITAIVADNSDGTPNTRTLGGFGINTWHEVDGAYSTISCHPREPGTFWRYYFYFTPKRIAHYGDRIRVGQWKVSIAIDGRPAFSFAGDDGVGMSSDNFGPDIKVALSDKQVAALAASRAGLSVVVENKSIGNQSLKFSPLGLAMTVLSAACNYDPKL